MTQPLPHELSGNKSSNKLLVFLHGWPDTTALWDNIIPTFEKDCYIVNVSYPNFSAKETKPKGDDFEVIVERLKVTLDQVNDTQRKVVFVGHDWGCFFTYMFDQRYPGYMTEMITLDVGLGAKITPFIIFYQVFLAIAFMIGGGIGTWMTRTMIKYFKYNPSWLYRINCTWNYPYFYLWRKILKNRGNKSKLPLYQYEPSCNIAFAWGAKKPVHFHGDAWFKKLLKNPNNEIHAVDSGHWIMREQPAFLIDLIRRRLLRIVH